MPQTLFAIQALGIASIFAFQQSQMEAQTDRDSNKHEIVRQAADVALARLAFYETLAYDEGVATGQAQNVGTLIGAITGHGNQTGDVFGNDVDDFHQHVMTVRRPMAGDTLGFQVGTRVAYVSELDGETPSHLPTKFKKVTVTVTPLNAPDVDPIDVSELYMCGSKCTF